MSLVLPVLVALIGGMVDFGLVLTDMNQARHGARETARAISVADLSIAPRRIPTPSAWPTPSHPDGRSDWWTDRPGPTHPLPERAC